MNVWAWAVAYAVGFVLVQLLVYYYYARRGGDASVRAATAGDPGGDHPVPGRVADPSEFANAPDPGDADARRCPHCGAPNENDPAYTYCRNCASQIGP